GPEGAVLTVEPTHALSVPLSRQAAGGLRPSVEGRTGRPVPGPWPHGPLLGAVSQATRQTRQRADGSVSGSPWTRKKSAGPPSTIRPASGSPSSSPPRTVAEDSASHGWSPASTSASTSHARWFARRDPPPKSVPVAIRTPAR